MKKLFVLIGFLFIALPIIALAHPGNTDSSGCHTCRTNCSNWGLSYGEYHCHNSKRAPQPEYPIHSTYGSGGTGYTTPAPDYTYPSIPTTPVVSKPAQKSDVITKQKPDAKTINKLNKSSTTKTIEATKPTQPIKESVPSQKRGGFFNWFFGLFGN